ncbi:neuromedin-U receptor 2-like [Acropora muricata]|uniref:neuromedin-U receptor 2-like n=1 Tax=Acropora muricata TaxID=159855 RepID=UPI0010FC96A2
MTSQCNDSNHNITFTSTNLKEPSALIIFMTGLQVAIGVFGVVGNAIVCLTIIRKPYLLGVTNQHIFSLSIADLGVLLINLPLAILKELYPFKWFLGETVCLYVSPATETFYGAAILSITLISFERYVNIAKKAIRARRVRSRTRRRAVLLGAWVASFVLTSAPTYKFYAYDSCHKLCYLTWSPTYFMIFMIALNVFLYYLPLAIITFSSLSIARVVSKRTRLILKEDSTSFTSTSGHGRKQPSSSLKTMLRQKKRTYRILKPLVILFAVTMFPVTVFRLMLIFWTEFPAQNYYSIILTLAASSTVVNSAADPLIYCVVNKEFRREVKRLLPGYLVGMVNRTFRKRRDKREISGREPQTTETAIQETYL